jgi:hypothetical protein
MRDTFLLLRHPLDAQEIGVKHEDELLNGANECNKWQINYLKINTLTIKAIGSWVKT